MNETTLQDVYNTLKQIQKNQETPYENEILVDETVVKWAKIALQRMFEI